MIVTMVVVVVLVVMAAVMAAVMVAVMVVTVVMIHYHQELLPGAGLCVSTSYALHCRILSTASEGWLCHDPHFTGEEPEAQSGKQPA